MHTMSPDDRYENTHPAGALSVRRDARSAIRALPIFLATILLAAFPAGPAGAQASTGQDDGAPPARQDDGAPTGIFTEEVNVRVINVDVIVTDRSG